MRTAPGCLHFQWPNSFRQISPPFCQKMMATPISAPPAITPEATGKRNSSAFAADFFCQPQAMTAPMKLWSIGVGGAAGLLLTILPVLFPKRANFFPSASGFGLAWIFQWYYGGLFFLGAAIAWGWQKKSAANAEEFLFPVASGVMAGGALMGVAIIFWQNGGEIMKRFFGH